MLVFVEGEKPEYLIITFHPALFIYLFIKLRPIITHKEKKKQKTKNKMARGAATA